MGEEEPVHSIIQLKEKKNQELLIFPISHAYMRYMLINLFIKKINSTSNYTMEH